MRPRHRTDACECGGPKRASARRCRWCHAERGGALTDAVLAGYGRGETPAQMAERLGTTVWAVYNTASRLRCRYGLEVPYAARR